MFWHEVWCVLQAFAPWLLLGAVVAGLLHAYLPPSFMSRFLRGRRGVIAGVAVGIPLPLCSCGVIPTALGLKRDGASDGATVGFLISTPQTGVDSVMVSAAFLGWPFALFKVAGAALTGVIGGTLADKFSVSSTTDYDPALVNATPPGFKAGFSHATTVLRSIWGWIVVGIVLSALISVYMPKDSFSQVAGWGSIGVAIGVLAVSLPLYVCTTASVPIAAALVANGMPVGAALIFLMAGPATNVATLGAVYEALGKRMLAVYLSTIVIGSVLLALVFDALYGNFGQDIAKAAGENCGLTHQVSSIILLVVLGWFAFGDIRDKLKAMRAKTSTATMVEVPVSGMTCGGCVRRLTASLESIEGAENVVVTLKPGRAQIAGTVTQASLARAVIEAGFKVSDDTSTTDAPKQTESKSCSNS